MKKILLTSALYLFTAAAFEITGFCGQTAPNTPQISRVIKHCGSQMTEINVAALKQSAEILQASHPELAAELAIMITELTR